MDVRLENIIHLIQQSPLDETVKNILIRDLEKDGLNDFLREQIKAYCLEGIKQLDEKMTQAKNYLMNPPKDQP